MTALFYEKFIYMKTLTRSSYQDYFLWTLCLIFFSLENSKSIKQKVDLYTNADTCI